MLHELSKPLPTRTVELILLAEMPPEEFISWPLFIVCVISILLIWVHSGDWIEKHIKEENHLNATFLISITCFLLIVFCLGANSSYINHLEEEGDKRLLKINVSATELLNDKILQDELRFEGIKAFKQHGQKVVLIALKQIELQNSQNKEKPVTYEEFKYWYGYYGKNYKELKEKIDKSLESDYRTKNILIKTMFN